MTGTTSVLVEVLTSFAYLAAATLFIVGLKKLSSPATARVGNVLGAVGMLLAIVATLIDRAILGYTWILIGMLIGSGIGIAMARLVKMTAMPQMVGTLNGFGGGASVLVATAEYLRSSARPLDVTITIVLSVLVGGVTFSGSAIAAAKLQELVTGRAVVYPLQKTSNALLFVVILTIGVYLVAGPPSPGWLTILIVLALVLGVLLVIPIGGADMPVVVSLLNSYSGIAGAMTGFVLNNHALIITGALVGASGIILTQTMCKAMNRSLANVVFGAFGAQPEAALAIAGAERKPVNEVTAEDAAILLGYASRVVFVPGYGMAVSQAQHQVRELGKALQARGVDVKYGIHPVAGRMPGHMNVLLAEADVSYDLLVEMDQINPDLGQTDVAVVIGANDVVNPAARHDASSPIYGMPIIDVDKAKTVIVLKRSMAAGFAGIDNELFYRENTRMLFGDAKKSLTAVTQELNAAVAA